MGDHIMMIGSPLRPMHGLLTSALLLLAAIPFAPSTASAAQRARAPKPGEFNPRHETVELFETVAAKSGFGDDTTRDLV
jgi:hypothetical protein